MSSGSRTQRFSSREAFQSYHSDNVQKEMKEVKELSLCTLLALQDWAEENFTSKVSEIAAALSSHKPARSSP